MPSPQDNAVPEPEWKGRQLRLVVNKGRKVEEVFLI